MKSSILALVFLAVQAQAACSWYDTCQGKVDCVPGRGNSCKWLNAHFAPKGEICAGVGPNSHCRGSGSCRDCKTDDKGKTTCGWCAIRCCDS